VRFVSLFAGIGGFDLGLERAGMQCVGQVEKDKFCQRVLAHHWPEVKRVENIYNVTGSDFEPVELICGGFPCQPFSTAGKRGGKNDDRYLWPEMLRVIEAYKPAWVLGENVAGIVSMALDTVLSDLENKGYTCQAFIIPACAVDAKHERKRVWIVANSKGYKNIWKRSGRFQPKPTQCCQYVSYPNGSGFGERRGAKSIQSKHCSIECVSKAISNSINNGYDREKRNEAKQSSNKQENWIFERDNTWLPEPGVGRVAHGVPGRVDRLRSLGNAVVPQVVEVIGKAILKANQDARSEKAEAGETASNTQMVETAE